MHKEITLLMKRIHFVGINFNTRGRITIESIEGYTLENEFLSCQRVGRNSLLFASQMVGRHLWERPIPVSDKIPWPVRQKEAFHSPFPGVALGPVTLPGTWDSTSDLSSVGWR